MSMASLSEQRPISNGVRPVPLPSSAASIGERGGPPGVRRHLGDLGGVSLRRDEIRDLEDSLVWLGRVHATGKASHVELDHDFAIHLLVRDGEAIRSDAFLTWNEALEAAGLRE